MSKFNPDTIYDRLSKKKFPDYDAFEAAIVKEFNKHIEAFPPGYTYRNFIRWGEDNKWVTVRQNGKGKEIVIEK